MGDWYPAAKNAVLGWARQAKAKTDQVVAEVKADPEVQRLAEQARTSTTAQNAQTAIASARAGGRRFLDEHPALDTTVDVTAQVAHGVSDVVRKGARAVQPDLTRAVDGVLRTVVDVVEVGFKEGAKAIRDAQAKRALPPTPPAPPDDTKLP